MSRPHRNYEVFELTCWQCASVVEIPCPQPHKCPHCEAMLRIEWREQIARAVGQIYPRVSVGRRRPSLPNRRRGMTIRELAIQALLRQRQGVTAG